MDELTDTAVPENIRLNRAMDLEKPYSKWIITPILINITKSSLCVSGEANVIKRIKEIVNKNHIWRSYIGMGYYNTKIPHTILRNMLENPGWYLIFKKR